MGTGTVTGAAARTATPEESWPLVYLREHVAHVLVLVILAAYPGIYSVLVESSLGAEFVMVLPRIETMVAVFYFGLFAMSFDFVSGYTGYLSFGHAIFYGTGAYFVVLAAKDKVPLLDPGTPFMILLLLAGLLAVVVAVLVGAVSFRLTGVYFAMITLGFAQVAYVFVRGWNYVSNNPRGGATIFGTTGGFEIGVPFVDPLNLAIGQLRGVGDTVVDLFGFVTFTPTEVSYYMIGVVVLVCYLAMQRLIHSPFGRVMIAIRENEERAVAIGYNTFWYKLAAFSVSGFFAGVAGALFAGFRRSVSPENTFFFLVTGDALLASIIGGFGTLAGPLYGRGFDEAVREFLSKEGGGGGLLPYLQAHLSQGALQSVIYNGMTVAEALETFVNGRAALYIGLLFVVFVLYVPGGLLGTVRTWVGGPVAKQVGERIRTFRTSD